MTERFKTTLYIALAAIAASAASAIAVWVNPTLPEASTLWLIPTLIALVALAGRFPFRISPQGEATLFTVPLFMAVILLPPAGAMLVGAIGCLLSESMLRGNPRVSTFNIANTVLSAGIASAVFSAMMPQGASMSLTPSLALAALSAGLALHATNLLLLIGMITLMKGRSYWHSWKDAWKVDAIQEGALIALGLVGALVTYQAGWGLILLLVPFVLGYFGFKRSVEEAVQKATLAEELQNNLRELKDTQAHLIQSAKLASVGTLAAGVAHEINNPVFAVTGRAEIFLRMLKNADDSYLRSEKAVRDMEIIMSEGGRIAAIVKHLLDYARNNSEMEYVHLNDAMDRSVELLAGKILRKGAKVVTAYESSPKVKAVSNRLEQVFMNLITNALDAMELPGTLTLGCKSVDGHAIAYVQDTGDGIPEELLDRIFEPFFTTKGVGNGTGLGMFICHKIVEEFGGDIEINSAQGVGTTIMVKLPLAADDRLELDSESSAEQIAVAAG